MKLLSKTKFYILFLLYISVVIVEGRTVAVFYALDEDEQAFRQSMRCEPVTSTIGTTTIFEYKMLQDRVFWVKMGPGCVQTAMSVQTLLGNNHHCDLVFSLGPVGAISSAENLHPGQWVIISGVHAYQKGVVRADQSGNGTNKQWALKPYPDPVPDLWKNIPAVTVASGELFIASDDYRLELSQIANASVVDMNLFGLLWVCDAHQVADRSYHFRIISDLADNNAFNDFKAFIKNYDGEGGRLMHELLVLLPEDKTDPMNYPNLKNLLTGGDG